MGLLQYLDHTEEPQFSFLLVYIQLISQLVYFHSWMPDKDQRGEDFICLEENAFCRKQPHSHVLVRILIALYNEGM